MMNKILCWFGIHRWDYGYMVYPNIYIGREGRVAIRTCACTRKSCGMVQALSQLGRGWEQITYDEVTDSWNGMTC